ncbi:lipoprotein signal peptidase [Prevotella histicola]|uniref:lipoprotein signal peptidase n=1 Tax=Prevotella histicola TaxID=470565 RepID=UPI001C5CE7CA|nr:lipoprotein signal peptidase [Prevotella histicola]MBW4775825.1 lipoprotein signal peptidase [Prevotella histicola]
MYSNKKKSLTAASLIVLLLIIDQIIKVTVKLHMNLGEAIHVFDWFQIEFVENNGMAWGMELGSKLFLSIFRIVAVGFLIWYISDRIKRGARMGYIIVLSMICAGAAGNIFDSLIYGQIFTASTPYYLPGATPSTLVSWGEGYAPMMMGKVVDMFYFPLFHGTFPDWCPLWGGESFIFFSPVFNFADSCISVGVFAILLAFRKDFNGWTPVKEAKVD